MRITLYLELWDGQSEVSTQRTLWYDSNSERALQDIFTQATGLIDKVSQETGYTDFSLAATLIIVPTGQAKSTICGGEEQLSFAM